MSDIKFKRIPTMLVLGAGAFILGVVLLALSLGTFPSLGAFIPVVIILAGLFWLNLGYFIPHRKEYIFFGLASALVGMMAFLNNTVLPRWSFDQIWPIYMGLIGISMIPYAVKHSYNTRVTLLIPAMALILMALVFVPFSFDLVTTDFLDFVRRWWPLLLILFGVVMIVTYFFKEYRRRRYEKG